MMHSQVLIEELSQHLEGTNALQFLQQIPQHRQESLLNMRTVPGS